LFPNPAVLGRRPASQTKNIEIRAGSVVLPLNDEVRIAEDWSVVDNLSNGRVSLSIASGWHADDFVLMPQNYPQRHEIMFRQIEALKALWRGESIKRINGLDKEIEVKIFPRPLQPELPVWITSAGNRETFKAAGKIGAKILTHLLGQDVEDLEKNIVFYKQSLKENGYSLQDAKVAIMLHTYVGADLETVKTTVREPFKSYLRSSVSLVKNLVKSLNISNENFDENDIEAILEIAFERYWQTSALLGTVESCSPLVEKLHSIGCNRNCLFN
jgi:natural product biosynthesis luciferase-like monooxygenase protein